MLEWDIWLLSIIATKLVIYLTSFLSVGSLIFTSMLKPLPTSINQSLLRLSMIAAILSVAFTLLHISLQAGQLYDDGFVGLYDMEMIGLVADSPLGTSSYVRLIGLGFVIVAIILPLFRTLHILVSSILIAGSFAIVGHATKDLMVLGVLITIHLLSVSYWVGGLYPLYKLAGKTDDLVNAANLAHKFGIQAAVIVPVLIIAGIAFSILLVGSPARLLGTEYGLLLITKVLVVTILLALAALNKFRLVPQLLVGDHKAAYQLRNSIRIEFIAFLLIFATTAILTSAVNLPSS